MTAAFLDEQLDTRSTNGRDDLLLSSLRFLDTDGSLYRVPIGADTDGGSTPRLCWLVPGFEPTGKHWFSWILHDSGYRGTLQIFRKDQWQPARLTQNQCDKMLDRALEMQGTHAASRRLVYISLRTRGHKSFKGTP